MEEKSVKKRGKGFLITSIVILVFSFLFFWGSTVFADVYRSLKESDTIEITATIKNINPINFYTINVEEYNAGLCIYYQDIVLDMNEINNFSIGQEITFRIRLNERELLEDSSAKVEIVSLTSNESEIITLESYNTFSQKMKQQAINGFIGGGIFFLVLGGIFLTIYICLNLKRKGEPK